LRVDVDHHALRRPSRPITAATAQTVGTPAIDSNLARDVYVTFDAVGGNGATSGAQVQNNLPAGSVVLGVTVEPLLAWLWIGGLCSGSAARCPSCAVATVTRRTREAHGLHHLGGGARVLIAFSALPRDAPPGQRRHRGAEPAARQNRAER
jgi:hypothetical protein